ncbi:MAG: hypothetical protein ACOYMA_07525 [Bacteroidia bacterium]
MHQWKTNKYLMIFADCIVVKGNQRALIADLTRGKYHFIPNTLAEMLTENKGRTKESIIENYGTGNTETIEEYISFLEENEFVFWCDEDEIELFPPIDLTWEWPAHITNAIFDINETNNLNFEDIVEKMVKLTT